MDWHDLYADSKPIQRRAEMFLTLLAPRDLAGNGIELYVLARSELDDPLIDAGGKKYGFTGFGLDLILQSTLEKLGLWRGRGAAAVVYDGVHEHPNVDAYLFLCNAIHELGHILVDVAECPQMYILPLDQWPEKPPTLTNLAAAAARWAEPRPSDLPSWNMHELDFIRTSLHLIYRSRALLFRATPHCCGIAGSNYGLSAGDVYNDLLGDEPERWWLRNRPLTDLANDPAPVAFSELFASDTTQAIAAA